MSDLVSTAVERLTDLARAQIGGSGGWSLATDPAWLVPTYSGDGVVARVWDLPDGSLAASAAVRMPDPEQESGEDVTINVTSMVRPGSEHLWDAQLEWLMSTVREADIASDTARVRAVSEALTDAEVARWAAAGFQLVFEELVMEREATIEPAPLAPRPAGLQVLDWSPDAAAAAFDAYVGAFQERPGYPGWSRSEWTRHLTGGGDFLPEASFCALVDGRPAGFVVSTMGWIDQVGVVPYHRRSGIATALVTEATARMQARGTPLVRLRVNADNAGAQAAWRGLGWRTAGRRGRLESALPPR